MLLSSNALMAHLSWMPPASGTTRCRIAVKVVSPSARVVEANATVILKIKAEIPCGTQYHPVRTVGENRRILKINRVSRRSRHYCSN